MNSPMTEHDARIHSFRQWWRRTQRGGFGYAQVWEATKNLPQRLYAKQLRSAALWAIVFPFVVILATILAKEPLLLLAIPIAYVLQVIRIAARSKSQSRWIGAALIFLAKFPEAIGAARFVLAGGQRRMPEYKS